MVHLVLIISVLLLMHGAGAFHGSQALGGSIARASSTGGDVGGTEEQGKIKLPIVQCYDEKREMLGEFVCGNDLSGSIDKIRATLAALSRDSPTDGAGRGVDNVYSDEQLSDILLRGESLLMLKIYREGCKKCTVLEPVFADMAAKSTNARIRWLQADVANIPLHTAALKLRLKGGSS